MSVASDTAYETIELLCQDRLAQYIWPGQAKKLASASGTIGKLINVDQNKLTAKLQLVEVCTGEDSCQLLGQFATRNFDRRVLASIAMVQRSYEDDKEFLEAFWYTDGLLTTDTRCVLEEEWAASTGEHVELDTTLRANTFRHLKARVWVSLLAKMSQIEEAAQGCLSKKVEPAPWRQWMRRRIHKMHKTRGALAQMGPSRAAKIVATAGRLLEAERYQQEEAHPPPWGPR